jgi:signal transduction histidine kinase
MKNMFPQVSTPVSLRLQPESPIACPIDNTESVLEHLAHELRQPLSVIESLAYYLELTSKDEGACVHLRQIQSMVCRANRILADASAR